MLVWTKISFDIFDFSIADNVNCVTNTVVTVTKVVVAMSRPQVTVARCHEVHGTVQNQKSGIDLVVDPNPDPGHMSPEKTNERNIRNIKGDETAVSEVVQDIVEAVIVAEIGVENGTDGHRHERIAVVNQMTDDDTMIVRKN